MCTFLNDSTLPWLAQGLLKHFEVLLLWLR